MSKSYKELREEFRDDLKIPYKVEPNTGMVNEHDEAYTEVMNIIEGMKDDAINPSHYKHGHIETIDYMRAIATHDEYCGHLRLTAIKYLSRLGKKDKSSQEVGKAIWYLEKLKTALEEYESFMMEGETE